MLVNKGEKMKIFFELEEVDEQIGDTSVALGTFDGLHIGHVEVLELMKVAAKEKGLKSFVYTFSNHPKEILAPDAVPPKIMDIDEKVQIFTRIDVDYLALIRFDESQTHYEPEDFVSEVPAWQVADNAPASAPGWRADFTGNASVPSWTDPDKSVYPMSMTAVVRLSPVLETLAADGDMMAAFIGGECRGVAKKVMNDGVRLFFLHVNNS